MFRSVREFKRTFVKSFVHDFQLHRSIHEWIPPQGYDTGIQVYSKIVKKNVPLIFLNKNYVKWYICGPTVYDVSHIGHASCYLRFDMINRILQQFFDIHPVIALGVTDVDDKVIKQAWKLKTDIKSLARKYELEFFEQMNELNILPPSFVLRVSDHIPEIIEFVSKIVERGQGYKTKDGSVYFDASNFQKYGKLVPIPEKGSSPLQEGQKSYLDFALWKGAKTNEPSWPSPWGEGRPGWHIECSAMASKVFGSQLDLHSGGVDLVFPHHENEEAQSCSYHCCDQWVNYWLHAGELQVKDNKMSKSLKNYVSITDFLKQYSPDNLRMLNFISSYNKCVHYCDDSVRLAVYTCKLVTRFLSDTSSYVKGTWFKGNISESELLQRSMLFFGDFDLKSVEALRILRAFKNFMTAVLCRNKATEQLIFRVKYKELAEANQTIQKSLRDDFNTGECFQTLTKLMQNTLTMLNEEPTSTSRSPGAVAAAYQFVDHFFNSLGFQLNSLSSAASSDLSKLEFVINQSVNFRVQVRNRALASGDKTVKGDLLKACDALRDEFESVGICIKDQGKDVSSWSFLEPVKKEKESAG